LLGRFFFADCQAGLHSKQAKKSLLFAGAFLFIIVLYGAMFLGTERPTLCLLLFLLWLPQGQFSSPATMQCSLTAVAGRSLKNFFSLSTFFWVRANSRRYQYFFH
jgi:hypothetical protein